MTWRARIGGNMRCFEALGCGALMVSDHGYPEGICRRRNHVDLSQSRGEAAVRTTGSLENWGAGCEIAANGQRMASSRYSKAVQWEMFKALI